MPPVRELTDAELDIICGGHHHEHRHGGLMLFNELLNSLFQSLFRSIPQSNTAGITQDNITVQIGFALGGSVTNINSTAQSLF